MSEQNPAEHQPKPGIEVVKAVPEDAESVRNIQAQTWIDTYPNDAAGITVADIRERVGIEDPEENKRRIEGWREGIANGSRNVFVAKINGKIAGFVAPGKIDGQHRVGAIYVLPEAQGKGAGKLLLQKAIEESGQEDLYLHVATYNQRAIDFYKSFGFQETGRAVTDEVAKLRNGKEIPEIEMVRPATK